MTISAGFKTLLGLYMPVSILEEEIEDRQRGKISRSKFSNVILEAGGLLSDQEK